MLHKLLVDSDIPIRAGTGRTTVRSDVAIDIRENTAASVLCLNVVRSLRRCKINWHIWSVALDSYLSCGF